MTDTSMDGSATRGHVKGSLYLHLPSYVASSRNETAWHDVLRALAPTDRAAFDEMVLPGQWYPVGSYNRALSRFMAEHATDTQAEARRYAEWVAERDLNTVFKVLLKMATPEFLLRRTDSLWSRYFDTGTFKILREMPKKIHLGLTAPTTEDDCAGQHSCPGICGWLEHGLKRTGATKPSVIETACRFHTGRHCEFHASWS